MKTIKKIVKHKKVEVAKVSSPVVTLEVKGICSPCEGKGRTNPGWNVCGNCNGTGLNK